MKPEKICDKSMTFQDCELAILRLAVDKAEEKMGKRVVQSDDIKKIIVILENFIKKKSLIAYGGTAINNILPKEDQFYNKEVEVPDYDCFTMNGLNDAIELADLYYKRTNEYIELWGYDEWEKMFISPNYDYNYFDNLDEIYNIEHDENYSDVNE